MQLYRGDLIDPESVGKDLESRTDISQIVGESLDDLEKKYLGHLLYCTTDSAFAARMSMLRLLFALCDPRTATLVYEGELVPVVYQLKAREIFPFSSGQVKVLNPARRSTRDIDTFEVLVQGVSSQDINILPLDLRVVFNIIILLDFQASQMSNLILAFCMTPQAKKYSIIAEDYDLDYLRSVTFKDVIFRLTHFNGELIPELVYALGKGIHNHLLKHLDLKFEGNLVEDKGIRFDVYRATFVNILRKYVELQAAREAKFK